jgi:hypothetical protein
MNTRSSYPLCLIPHPLSSYHTFHQSQQLGRSPLIKMKFSTITMALRKVSGKWRFEGYVRLKESLDRERL